MIIILICCNNIIIMVLIKVNNKKKEKKISYNFCFICYEINIPDERKPMKLKTQKYYIKDCSCDGLIHKYCLDIWYSKTKKCPICREHIFDLETFKTLIVTNDANVNDENHQVNDRANDHVNDEQRDVVVVENRPTLIYLFYIIKSKYKITKLFFILGLLFCIYNFYISLINYSYDKYKNKIT